MKLNLIEHRDGWWTLEDDDGVTFGTLMRWAGTYYGVFKGQHDNYPSKWAYMAKATTVTRADDTEVELPTCWAICGCCLGEGKTSRHVECDGGGFTASEWAEACYDDPDFADDYFAGRYDRACDECGGSSKIKVVDDERCDPQLLTEWREQCRLDREFEAMAAAERRMGMRFPKKIEKLFKRLVAQRQQDDWLAARFRLAGRIDQLAEDGKVAIVYGGIDCDGGRWDNRVTLVPANVPAVILWSNRYDEGAEGRQWWHLERPSDVADLEPESRDLALEAFEDGHAHVLYV